MSRDRAAVTVRIGGEEHHLRSSADPDHTLRCAALVDERIQEVRAHGALVDLQRATILAALSMADELLRVRDELEGLSAEVPDRLAQLATRIREDLAPE